MLDNKIYIMLVVLETYKTVWSVFFFVFDLSITN